MQWNKLSVSDKAALMRIYIENGITDLDVMRQHYNSFATGGALPDHDPNNPYHYHNARGEKIVITPEDWEANVGKPYFKETEQAVLAEQAAYPEPEYEVNPSFVRSLRNTYSDSMGYGYQNYRNFGSSLPQGYSFTDEGLIVDPQGNYYVRSGYEQSPRFTYNTDNPLKFTIYKGTSIEKNLTFYPINMEKKLKEPLPIDRVMNVNEELVKPIRQSSTQPKTASKNTVKHKTTIPVQATHPQSKQYGDAKWNALSQKQKRAVWDFIGMVVTQQKYTGWRGAFNHEGYSMPVYSPSLSKEATEGYWSSDGNQEINNFIHSYKTWGDVIKAIGLKDDVKNLPDYRIYEPRATLVRPSNNYEHNPKYKQSLNLLDSIFNAHENTNPLFRNVKHTVSSQGNTKALGGYLFAHGGATDGSKEDKKDNSPTVEEPAMYITLPPVTITADHPLWDYPDVMQAHYNQQGGKVGRNSNSANLYPSLPNNSRTYERWADAIARHKSINIANDKTYDYRRYYNENTEAAWRMLQANAEEHFPDTYKLPVHPTFSNESIYSRGPQMGGNWLNDSTFVPSVINRQYYPNVYREDRPYTEREIYQHEFQNGGIVTPLGQWQYPGKVTTIPSNNITMRGVNYPVIGISDKGDTKLMMPNRNYQFKGKSVTEYPLLNIPEPVNSYQRGGKINTDKNRYAFLRIEPEVSVSDNTRVVLPPSLIEIAKARAAYEAEQREKAILEASRRQPQLKADNRTQADRDRAAKQRQQAEYNRRANEAVGNTMSIGRPNTESTQAAVMAAPYVAKAAKNYVQNFDPTAEIRNAMYFVPGVSNVIMAQDARVAFDNNQAGAGVVNAAFALTPMLGVTPNFNSPLRHTRPANKVGDWTILDYGHNTAATTVQESSTASMLNMPSSLRLGSAERPSLSARPTQGSIGTTNRLQLPEMTESFRALENEAFGMDYLRSLYLNDGRISHQNPKTPKTQIQLPEYIKPQIRPLIRGAEIEKQLSKTGTISRKSLDAYIAKQGKYYQEAMNETLESDFKDMDKINYTDFQNAVQKRLPEYSRIPQTRYQKYGFNNLGLNTLNRDSLTEAEILRYAYDDELAALEQIDEDFDKGNINSDDRLSLREEIMDEITSTRLNTFTFETPGITGQSEHYSGKPVGHSRTYTTETEPEILHVMESQSDYAQHLNIERAKRHTLLKHMIDTYTERQIQENLKYAAEQGQTKMRYPTRKTVAKIEGYQGIPGREYYEITKELDEVNTTLYGLTHPPVPPIDITGRNTVGELREAAEVQQRIAKIMESDMYKQTIKKAAELEKKRREACDERHLEYLPEHETILKKYDAFPKQFQKLFGKKAEVRTVTDSKGNTWYEVDVPESYKNGTGQIIFSLGGLLGLGAGVNNH